MTLRIYFLILAVILLVLIPIVPHMLRIRIAVLRKIHWTWLADLHENHFGGFVMAVRIILLGIAIILLAIGLAGSTPGS